MRSSNSQGMVVTVPVHQGQDIGRGLLAKILHDAELSTSEFLRILRD